ncbi:MAG: tetratricopeptide repeat protein [candidate division WOR-3 bacterium]
MNINLPIRINRWLFAVLLVSSTLLAQTKTLQDSIYYYQSLIKKTPNNEPAWFALQKLLLQKGDFKTAQKLIRYDLSDRLFWGQIRIFFYSHQFDTIHVYLTEMAAKFPGSSYLNDALDLGILIASTKNNLSDLKNYTQAYFDYEIGNYENAIRECKQLITKSSKVSEYAYLLLHKIYLAKNEINQSLATLSEFVQKFPESYLNPKAQYEIGLIYLESLKDTARARTILEKLILDFPSSPSSFFARAKLSIIDATEKQEGKIR